MTSANAGVDHFWPCHLLTDLLARAFNGLGEDVSDADGVLAQYVGVDPQRHGGVVAEPCGHHVNRDPGEEQCGRVQVA